MKDRNKSRRKRPCQGEKYLSAGSAVPSKAIGSDGHPISDTQNANRLDVTKGPTVKRSISAGLNFGKGELPAARPVRQKRQPGDLQSQIFLRLSTINYSPHNFSFKLCPRMDLSIKY